MITWTPEHDTEGVPTDTRRIEIDPPEIDVTWREAVFLIGLALSAGAFVVGALVWMWTEAWPMAAALMGLCCIYGLSEESKP